MTKPRASAVVGIGPTWLDRRQMGLRNPLGTRCHIYEQLYSNILPCGCWGHTPNNPHVNAHGGVFSLEFSPEGSLLVAACEKRSVLMFDPLTQKRIHTIKNAHLDCVNCVKFLDSRSFATCSDDFTVALWDARNLRHKVRTLKGHSSWVKNIEYSPRDGLLVTSGFDGSVLTWEMNKYREDGNIYSKVFSTNGLMRTRLTPDATKMVVCTTGGYLVLIHNLDLNTLSQDLNGFRPNMYRLMQLSQTIFPIAADFTHLFRGRGKRNRVEFVADFPEGDDAEVVASLLIHPEGHSAISRNVTNNETSEWSCIHNIEERWSSDESDCTDDEREECEGSRSLPRSGNAASISTTPSYIIQHTVRQGERRDSQGGGSAGASQENPDLLVSPTDVWEALVAIQEARIRRETDSIAAEMYVGRLFSRHASDGGGQGELNVDNEMFVSEILENPELGREAEEEEEEEEESSPVVSVEVVSRGNVSVGAGEERGAAGGGRGRRKVPVRQRYGSLYRRSLVGQYDRTSILRKPIYNCRVNSLRKLRESSRLKTNYEMNETRRLERESGRGRSGEGSGAGAGAGGSRGGGGPAKSASRRSGAAGREVGAGEVSSSSVNAAINSLTQDLSSLENNLNSFRESLNNMEGTINSTCNALNRSQSILESINEMIGEEDVGGGDGREAPAEAGTSARDSRSSSGEEAAGQAEVDVDEEWMRSITGADRRPRRTVMMGVFRAGNQDGARGTSMRRRNVAALTISTVPQSSGYSVVNIPCLGMDDSTCSRSSESPSKKCRAKKRVAPVRRKIYENTKRLTHYVEEPNLGKGFIKELCISPDGRIICSPYGNGIRLLSFSPTVQDVLHCYPRSPPVPLHELTLNVAHADIVVSTKFSPYHNLLVSGCLSGKIVYYQPFL